MAGELTSSAHDCFGSGSSLVIRSANEGSVGASKDMLPSMCMGGTEAGSRQKVVGVNRRLTVVVGNNNVYDWTVHVK